MATGDDGMEIVVQEQLALHNEEREIVKRPAHDKEANEVVVLTTAAGEDISKGYMNRKAISSLWWKSLEPC